MNCHKEKLIDLLSNQLSEDNKASLEMHLTQCSECREELEAMKQIWATIGNIQNPQPSERLRLGFYSMLKDFSSDIEKKPIISFNELLSGWFEKIKYPTLALRLTYSFLLIGVGLIIGFLIKGASHSDYQQQIGVLSTQVEEMREMMLLSLIENPSATERLRAVSYTKDISNVNDKVIEALLTTLNTDPNVNVRLVTLEALYELADDPKVRKGLVQSLTKQKSPLVQLALVDMMVTLQEKRSVKNLRELLHEKNLNSSIKGKIEKSIKILS